MANEKMTYGKAIAFVLKEYDAVLPADVKEKLTGLSASLAKKNGAERKPTATQKANEDVKASIVDFLRENADKGFTCDDLIKNAPACATFSNQKVSALMRQVVEAGLAEKYSDKRRTYFKAIVA